MGRAQRQCQVYRQSLQQASALLQDHFSEENGQARGLRERIETLSRREVQVTLPDLAPALKALQAYVQQQETPESAAPAEPAADEQEAQRT
ncbi:uroporphyrin-III C-methyltransferase [Pseudomonas sp. BAY1663]|nr:uroporphyrin-III C-methyltransferase [Pseudomonas sp. BAY1663]